MGTTIDAHCTGCGYDTVLPLGGGFANYTTHFEWPVICSECAAIATANLREFPLACLACGNLDCVEVTTAWKGDGQVIQKCDDSVLTDGHYRCPKCGAFELRFGTNAGGHPAIQWD